MEKVYATASVWTVKMKYWKHIGNKKKEWHFSRCSTSLLFKHLLQMLLKKEACLQLCFPGCRKQYLQTIKCGRNIRLTFTKHTIFNVPTITRNKFLGGERRLCFIGIWNVGNFKNHFATSISKEKSIFVFLI